MLNTVKNNRPKMEPFMLTPTSPNQDLIINPIMYRFSSTKNGNLNQPIRSHSISASIVICLTDPLPSPKGKRPC